MGDAMNIIADILLAAGAFGAAFYCFVLSRRLRAFNDLEGSMGGAVAVLSAQVDDLRRTLETAKSAAGSSADALSQLTARAEEVARQLELMMAAMHDLPEAPAPAPEPQNEVTEGTPVFARHARREAAE